MFVIPAKAGIQLLAAEEEAAELDSGFRRNDELRK
jgi:hypothetical protein